MPVWYDWLTARNREQFGPNLREPADLPLLELVTAPYLHPDNPANTGPAALAGPFTGTLTDPNRQVFQVTPAQWYDTALVTVHDTGASGQNQVGVNVGRLRSESGVLAYPSGGVIPNEVPDWVGSPFAEYASHWIAFPLGTVPFWLTLAGSSGVSFAITVLLLERR